MLLKKVLLIITLSLISLYGYCRNNFNITVFNNSTNVIELHQGAAYNWNDAGQLSTDSKVTINPYQSYVWSAWDRMGSDVDSFWLQIPQQGIGKKIMPVFLIL